MKTQESQNRPKRSHIAEFLGGHSMGNLAVVYPRHVHGELHALFHANNFHRSNSASPAEATSLTVDQ